MFEQLRPRLTYANVMSTIAVFVVLGGSAYALTRGEVKSKHIAKNAVKTKQISDGAVTSAKLADGLGGQAGPQGPQGPQGPVGPKGDTGPQGDSAWDAACNKGLAANDVMVRVGSVCVDKYESSIWDARTGGNQITGAIPCNVNGQDCTNIYARSVAGVAPKGSITWFQAQQALANSGKRLPSNAEWQMAVAGTPDPGTDNGTTDCNVSTCPAPLAPGRALPASQISASTTWSVTSTSGWPTGCRDRAAAEAGRPATGTTVSALRGRPRPAPPAP